MKHQEPDDMQEDPTEDGLEKPSKSARKREMSALQTLGEDLVNLNLQTLKALELPEPLYQAILDAKRFKQHGAKRRQLQFIGKLMRKIDPGPILAKLKKKQQG